MITRRKTVNWVILRIPQNNVFFFLIDEKTISINRFNAGGNKLVEIIKNNNLIKCYCIVVYLALRNAQDSFSLSLKEFQVGFIGDTNEEESDIVDTLDCTYSLFQDVKEFSTKMINTGHTLIKQLEIFRKDRLEILKVIYKS